MKIQFEQTGGYAGLIKGTELDIEKLAPSDAAELTSLVESSGIQGGEFLSSSARDLYQYEITISDGTNRTTALFDDETIPPSAKALVGYLKKRAQPVR